MDTRRNWTLSLQRDSKSYRFLVCSSLWKKSMKQEKKSSSFDVKKMQSSFQLENPVEFPGNPGIPMIPPAPHKHRKNSQGRSDVLKKPGDGWSNAFTVAWVPDPKKYGDCGMLLWGTKGEPKVMEVWLRWIGWVVFHFVMMNVFDYFTYR